MQKLNIWYGTHTHTRVIIWYFPVLVCRVEAQSRRRNVNMLIWCGLREQCKNQVVSFFIERFELLHITFQHSREDFTSRGRRWFLDSWTCKAFLCQMLPTTLLQEATCFSLRVMKFAAGHRVPKQKLSSRDFLDISKTLLWLTFWISVKFKIFGGKGSWSTQNPTTFQIF